MIVNLTKKEIDVLIYDLFLGLDEDVKYRCLYDDTLEDFFETNHQGFNERVIINYDKIKKLSEEQTYELYQTIKKIIQE